MKKILGVAFLLLFFISSFAQKLGNGFDASKLAISWQLVENNHNNKGQALIALTFTNTSKKSLPANGWKIYFNYVRDVAPASADGTVKVQQVNGDLFVLSPVLGFQPLQPGQSVRVEFLSSDWIVNITDTPTGFYLVWDGSDKGISINQYTIFPFTEDKQFQRFPGDKTARITPQDLFNQNKNITNISASSLTKIFPTPVSYLETGGSYIINQQSSIKADAAFLSEKNYLEDQLNSLINNRETTAQSVIQLNRKDLPTDAYELQVTNAGIVISASSGSGIFYGIQSLLSLLPPDAWKSKQNEISLPNVSVKDAPRFGFRSFVLDVTRNFQPQKQILKLLDLLALYKMNVLHLHFSDDEGWRIEMPSLPELTDIGSKRGYTIDNKANLQSAYGSGPDINNPYGSGHYSKAEFIEILKDANQRHIQVIPEVETPGHARAAIKAMYARYERLLKAGQKDEAEKYVLNDFEDKSVYSSAQLWNDNVMNVSLPSVYNFIERVVDDLREMYAEAGAPLATIHMGGDEVPAHVWEKSPAYLALKQKDPSIKSTDDLWSYYFTRVNAILKKRNLFLSGWEEAGMRKTKLDGNSLMIPNPEFVPEKFQLDVWNNVLGSGAEDLAYKLAETGYKVVLSCVSNNYFDMAYYKDFEEPGYYWGSFVDIDKPFYFIPYDYFKNANEDKFGNPINHSMFVGKQRLTDYGKSNIVGIQGLLWSENVRGTQRMEYMMLPKLLGLAERAWAADPEWATEKDSSKSAQLYQQAWSQFVNVVGQRELPRLDYYAGGYNYRIPVPGLEIKQGKVIANIQLPGFRLFYTTDGTEPTSQSNLYNGPITAKGKIIVKAFDTRGRSGRSAVVVNP